jgi:hypothetical protein
MLYDVQVTITIKKTYTVKADNKDEAVEKLAESGVVSSTAENGVPEDYDEEYNVLGKSKSSKKPDVE